VLREPEEQESTTDCREQGSVTFDRKSPGIAKGAIQGKQECVCFRKAQAEPVLPGLGYNFCMAQAATTVRVKVLFFGRLRELIEVAEEAPELPEGLTLAQVFERYAERFPKLAGFRGSMVVSRNQEFAAWETRIVAGDEIAFLPPVSGG
jgi:molybdopterin converting factor subunit 1